jgi:energy-coupling factor transporter ATP-binding protein EcfA2
MRIRVLRIVGIAGESGSGKSTVAQMIADIYREVGQNTRIVGLADPMKTFCQEIFDWPESALWGPSHLRNVAPEGSSWRRPDGAPLTPRFALQTLGSEWGRNCDSDLWAKVWQRQTLLRLKSNIATIAPDVRFQNEVSVIKATGGLVIRVVRPTQQTYWKRLWREVRRRLGLLHASELGVVGDVVLFNDSTLEDLRVKVRRLVNDRLAWPPV